MKRTPDGGDARPAYGELAERCLRTRQALEGLSADPIPPPLLQDRVREANRLAQEIVSLFSALRRYAGRPGDQAVPILAGQVPLGHLEKHTRAIEDCMKLVRQQGTPHPGIVRPPLVAFRVRAQRLERRQNLLSLDTPALLQKAVCWAAGSGGQEELKLLRRIERVLEEPPAEMLDLIRIAKAEISRRSREERERLRAIRNHRHDPGAALRAMGEVGSRNAGTLRSRPQSRNMPAEPSPVPVLLDVLVTGDNPILRAEAAWALGQVGGMQAARCLVREVLRTWHDPSLPGAVRAALVAALGQALDLYTLYRMAQTGPAALRSCYGLLLREARSLDLRDDGLQMDLIVTLVSIELRSELVGVDLRAGSSLACFLGAESDAAVQTIAAVAALSVLADEGERRDLWRWVQGQAKRTKRLEAWPERLAQAAGRPFALEELRGFLLAASRFEAIQEDVEASFRLLRDGQNQEQALARGKMAS